MTRWIIDDLLPTYEFSTRYSRRIAADPATVWRSLHEITAADLPVTGLLMSVRSGGRNRMRGSLAENAPQPRLAENPGHEAVHGAIAQFWRLRPRRAPIAPTDATAFAAFNEPGWAKAALSFQFVPDGNARTVLSVETRVHTTDDASRRRFAPYWLLIKTGGAGFIRLEMLRAVARHAEKAAGRPAG